MFIMQNILPMTKMFKTGLIYSSRIANPLSQTVKTAHFSNVGRLSTRKANITLLGCKDCGKKLLTWQFVRMFTVFSKPSVHSISKTLLNNGNNKFLIRTISEDLKSKQNTTSVLYIASAVVFMIGASYAGVPLYRMFCQSMGTGGDPRQSKGHDTSKIATMKPIREEPIKIVFNADTPSSMQWNFRPQQAEMMVVPGETALAFYKAKNPTDKPVVGISTYNVLPYDAALYFNKIQCFCFEEQLLNPHEEVDMPVFFYIDPEFLEDPRLEYTTEIVLSYTFFEAKDGLVIPLPGFMNPQIPEKQPA